MLDAASVRPDTILLLDTFFHVVIFHGETIGAWREQGCVHGCAPPALAVFMLFFSVFPFLAKTASCAVVVTRAPVAVGRTAVHPLSWASSRYICVPRNGEKMHCIFY